MKFRFFVLAAMALSAGSATAATLTASPSFSDRSGFTIEFDDINGNGLLEATEVRAFSGVSLRFTDDEPFEFYHTLLAVSDVPGISTFGFVPGTEDLLIGPILEDPTRWQFFGEPDDPVAAGFDIANLRSPARNWTYEVTGLGDNSGVPAPVPLPAGLPLILAGLGALGAVRRWGK